MDFLLLTVGLPALIGMMVRGVRDDSDASGAEPADGSEGDPLIGAEVVFLPGRQPGDVTADQIRLFRRAIWPVIVSRIWGLAPRLTDRFRRVNKEAGTAKKVAKHGQIWQTCGGVG
jgi:hypothetical protein